MTDSFIHNLISLTGKSNKDKDLLDFFIKNSFIESENDINLPMYDEDGDLLDEYNFYINKYSYGLSFIFTDESFFLNQSDKPIMGDKLYLTTIFFYNDEVEGFTKYTNELPYKIKLSMDKSELEKQLGKPLFTKNDNDGVVRSQKWKITGSLFTLYASYKNNGDVRYISLSLPY